MQEIDNIMHEAIALHRAGKLKEAETLYRLALEIEQKNADANHNLGLITLAKGQEKQALSLFRVALEANPKQGQYWLSYINTLIQLQEIDAAKKILGQGISKGLSGDKVDLLIRQLNLEKEPNIVDYKGKNNQSINLYRRSSEDKSKKGKVKQASFTGNIQALTKLLLELHKSNDYIKCEELAYSIIKKYPNHLISWTILGSIFKSTGRLSEALSANRKVVEMKPNNADAHYNEANTLKDLGKFEEAEKSYLIALNINKNFTNAYFNYAHILTELGRYLDAEVVCKKLISINPNFVEAYGRLGVILIQTGRLLEAETSYKKALELKPDYLEGLFDLSICCLYGCKYSEAAYFLNKLVILDKSGYGLKAKIYLALLLYLNGKLNECKGYIDSSSDISKGEHINFRIESAYWRFLSELVKWHSKNISKGVRPNYVEKIYVIGESHSLVWNNIEVKKNAKHYFCESKWILGCKQWHLGNTRMNHYKKCFERLIDGFPKNSQILLTIGEIDCRIDEGIIPVLKKNPEKTLEGVVISTITSYITYVSKITKEHGHKLIISGIPAPNINLSALSIEDSNLLIKLIRVFNEVLLTQAIQYGHNFLNVYALTNRGDGISNKQWHIDDFHINPSAIPILFNDLYIQAAPPQ